ncbi:hypothetical protein BDV96DRAFT_2483 [Lophiotrema nucula]|uniref:Uncharacterized protein n=1 Tax=Lophiotrema nucula TaxID=690887 RepID=A0A6A5ZSE5_9PLEO|nr:hypothetical protein BDV96DRAFT_2483 [Lophiotrema nucula]
MRTLMHISPGRHVYFVAASTNYYLSRLYSSGHRPPCAATAALGTLCPSADYASTPQFTDDGIENFGLIHRKEQSRSSSPASFIDLGSRPDWLAQPPQPRALQPDLLSSQEEIQFFDNGPYYLYNTLSFKSQSPGGTFSALVLLPRPPCTIHWIKGNKTFDYFD